MSFPHIVWTLRRTGGTTLAQLLSQLQPRETLSHEPFNRDRVLGWITKGWDTHKDPAQLRYDIDQALAVSPAIKHCHELMPAPVNQGLLDATTALGYRHIILDRKAEAKRIISLELARITGAWGPQQASSVYQQIEAGTLPVGPIDIDGSIAHMQACNRRRKELDDMLIAAGQSARVVYFEDVYTNFDTGRGEVKSLMDFLDIPTERRIANQDDIETMLTTRSQNTARIANYVPNMAEAEARITQAVAPYTYRSAKVLAD